MRHETSLTLMAEYRLRVFNAQKNIWATKEEVNRGLKESLLFPSNTIQVITTRKMRLVTYGGT